MTAPPAFKRKSNAKQKQKAVDGELKHSNSQTFLFRYEDYREATLAEFSKL